MSNEIMEMKGKRDIAGLFALLQSEKEDNWMLRLDAAEALVQLGDQRGLEYLKKMLESPNADVREVAAEILEELKDYQPEQMSQNQIPNQPDFNSLGYKVKSKYPYLIAWIAFVVFYSFALFVLEPIIIYFSIPAAILFPIQVVIGFFVFRFVIDKFVLPYKKG